MGKEGIRMKAIVTVGISASGKSTFANEWLLEKSCSRAEINRDQIRAFIVEDEHRNYPFTWAKWKWKWEKDVTAHATKLLERAVNAEYDVICSDTNLSEVHRNKLIEVLKSHGYEVEIKEFPIDIETAWARDAARKNGVGHSVIAKQFEQWLSYVRSKPHYTNTDSPIDFPKNDYPLYMADYTKPKCILVDIDGSLAHVNGKRGIFEWDKVGLDDVDIAVKSIVNAWKMMNSGDVIVLSGRDGICEPETREWLNKNGVQYDKLIMRKAGDMRDDREVKLEIFWRDIAPNYNCQFVIDDRPKIIRAWQEIGLKTFIVGNPWIEF